MLAIVRAIKSHLATVRYPVLTFQIELQIGVIACYIVAIWGTYILTRRN